MFWGEVFNFLRSFPVGFMVIFLPFLLSFPLFILVDGILKTVVMVVLQPNPKYIVYLFTTNVILKKNACTLKSIIHGGLCNSLDCHCILQQCCAFCNMQSGLLWNCIPYIMYSVGNQKCILHKATGNCIPNKIQFSVSWVAYGLWSNLNTFFNYLQGVPASLMSSLNSTNFSS